VTLIEEDPGTAPGSVADAAPVSPGRWQGPSFVTALAFGSLAVPFAVILIRFALASDRGVFLPDDLALIDLHTRVALHWQQALGPFDRFGWNHPGPAYYYLLSIGYRLLGGGAGAAFFGAALVNALAALGVVWVCRRRGGPVLALWAALCLGALELLLSINSPGALTYSEGALGAGVSPWTATVIIVPLLLFAVLCAATATPSPLSALGALLVGSFVVQTDLSAAPLVVVLLLLSWAAGSVLYVRDRRRATDDHDNAGAPATEAGARRRWRGGAWGALGVAVLVAMWIPPLVQNLTTHPGNLDLIYRFFTAPQPVHPLNQGFLAVMSVDAVAFFGPAEIMTKALGRAPAHTALAVVAFIVFVLVGAAAVARGLGRRNRFAVAMAAFSLAGLVAMVFAFSRITGLIYGYLVLWEVTLPTLALLGLGSALITSHPRRGPRRDLDHGRRRSPLSPVLGVLVALTGLALCARMVALPSLAAVSDPHVGAVVALVTPALPPPGRPVFVGDDGLDLIETEEFIGVVNQLDVLGYHPKVNHFWRTEFGNAYITPGGLHWHVDLLPWSPTAPGLRGYVGRVGGIAVTVATISPAPA
jgi:hypothetical protein